MHSEIMKPCFFALGLLLATRACWADCSITVPVLTFGVYNPVTTGNTDSSMNMTFQCSISLGATVTLSTGNSGTYTTRYMVGGRENQDKLNYNLYSNSTRTTVFGNGTDGTSTHGQLNVLPLVPTNLPLYGRIPAKQNVSAGSYSDIIGLSISF